jgi:hypothetical protein
MIGKQQDEIECGRCGEIRLEILSEKDLRLITEGTGPVYRECEKCGKTTGWIKATAGTDLTSRTNSAVVNPQSASDPAQRTPAGQERMASRSERREVNKLTLRPEAQINAADQ